MHVFHFMAFSRFVTSQHLRVIIFQCFKSPFSTGIIKCVHQITFSMWTVNKRAVINSNNSCGVTRKRSALLDPHSRSTAISVPSLLRATHHPPIEQILARTCRVVASIVIPIVTGWVNRLISRENRLIRETLSLRSRVILKVQIFFSH